MKRITLAASLLALAACAGGEKKAPEAAPAAAAPAAMDSTMKMDSAATSPKIAVEAPIEGLVESRKERTLPAYPPMR